MPAFTVFYVGRNEWVLCDDVFLPAKFVNFKGKYSLNTVDYWINTYIRISVHGSDGSYFVRARKVLPVSCVVSLSFFFVGKVPNPLGRRVGFRRNRWYA